MNRCNVAMHMEPNAARDDVVGVTSGYLRLRIAVRADDSNPEYGNEEIISFLSRLLGISKDSISILLGRNFRIKLLSIEGLDVGQVMGKLKPHMKG